MRALHFVRFVFLLAFCSIGPLPLGALAAQSIDGAWRGHIAVPGSKLQVVVQLREQDGALSGHIDIPAQDAKAMPLENVRRAGAKVEFAIADVPGEPTFRGELDADGKRMEGTFTQGGQRLRFVLERAAANGGAPANDAGLLGDFGTWLDTARERFSVPGCAVAVVKDGALLATHTSGRRDVEQDLPVTPDTLFPIGSSSKAFTTALLAMLVDDGTLDWDMPVRRWLPEFTLADAAIGERLTPRDLVTHRSGMPRHDLVWYGATFARAEMVARLRHLPLNHDLRTEFQYNNLMFLTAGHLAERVGGASWEELVRARILAPLGMQRTNFTVAAMQQDQDHGKPYRKDDGKVLAIPFRDITAIGPAGSINSSVREMAAWTALQLQAGEHQGKRLLAESLAHDLHTVRMPTGSADGSDAEVLDIGYALGWFVDVYRGHRRVHHGGNIDGFSALVALLPDDGLGVVVLTNLDGTPFPEVVVRECSDRLLKLATIDHAEPVLTRLAAAETRGAAGKQAANALRREGTKPSRGLDVYAGDYEHPGYGTVRVQRDGEFLRLDLHGLPARLQHWHDDVFACVAGEGEPGFAGTKVQFLLDFDGEVEALRAVLEPSVPPIVFERAPDARLRDAAFLQRLAGDYQLEGGGAVAKVTAEQRRLVLTLPGQRHELEPRRGLTCQLRGLPGYRVEFQLDAAGEPTGLRIHQPEGVFAAVRKGS